MSFDIQSIKSFRFVSYNFDESNATAKFFYALDDKLIFEEKLTFPGANKFLSTEQKKALDRCLEHLFLILGISYYKTAVPEKIIIENFALAEETAAFFDQLYLKGLSEFAYRNNLDLQSRIHFPFSKSVKFTPYNLELPRKTVVPIGGGKDSVVTLEILKQAQESMVLFSLGDYPVNQAIAKNSGIPLITVSRTLSPLLFELNAQGAYNGHIPISAIIAFILPVAAILYGFDLAALSNESSANVGTLISNGLEVNHQYSKSFEFEQDLSNYFKNHLLESFNYFSFLRPLSEIAIAKLFSQFKSYHSIFTSCNAVFRIRKEHHPARWCLKCPKCRFTFLALAPFLKKDELITIFGTNLLDDPTQIFGYDELIGASGFKPFECVGEEKEALAALAYLVQKPEWREDLVVARFAKSKLAQKNNYQHLMTQVLEFSNQHLLPSSYENLLKKALKAGSET